MWSSTVLMLTLGWSSAQANPSLRLVDRACRHSESPFFLGAPSRDSLSLARCIDWEDAPSELSVAAESLALEVSALESPSEVIWGGIEAGRISLGEMEEPYLSGDQESGFARTRFALPTSVYASGLSLRLRPELGLNWGGEADLFQVAIRDAWLGYRHDLGEDGLFCGGLGIQDRWIGPGRRGSLMLTNHAFPAPALSIGAEGAPRPWARVRTEMGAGWLNGERSDVGSPGWLFMDMRWMPAPGIELGASRVGIFGGEGRPSPRLGQLLLPTDPHVYDDPDGELPDQDEIAALDARIHLPLERWLGLQSLRYLEFWWQYGAEDIIALESFGIPYPSLAGIANLYGAELAIGDVRVVGEGARIFDDYFRWYTGHRIYHQGFTRNEQSMGHWTGGDAYSGWLSVTWLTATQGVEIWGEQITHIGVVENVDDRLLSLMEEQHTLRAGVKAWRARSEGRWWGVSIGIEKVEGAQFVPGADQWSWRLGIEG
jgi:hypothetical protein